MDRLFGVHALFRFDLLGTSVGLPVGVVVQWGVMALAFLAVFLMRRNAKPAPMALQNFSEILASTLKRWTSRKKAAGRAADQASGSAGKRLDPSPEGLSAAVVTAAIFLFVFWLTEAVTTLTTSPGPVSRLVGWLAPGFNALKEQTIVGPILARFSGQDIGTEITSAIQVREIFGFDLFGIHIAVADVVVVMWVVMLFLLLVSLWLGRGFHPVPKGKQLVAENLVVSFQKLCGTVMMQPPTSVLLRSSSDSCNPRLFYNGCVR